MKSYHVISFGCQMNDHDAEKMHGILEHMGYTGTGSLDQADLVLINTCCVRETAENKVYGLLGRLRKLKEKKPGLIIGVGGCMTQVKETALHIKRRYPYVNLVFGTGSLHQLPELISRAAGVRGTLIDTCPPEGIHEGVPAKRASGLKAWVPIIYGCNNFCTYCIVPHVRGRERSRRPEEVIKEVEQLAGQGYREVTLLGQNVNSYGKDLDRGYGFAELLADLDRVRDLARIRFMTSHPRDFTAHLIEAIKNSGKVCEHIHLPIQSGSDRILKKMNRGYSREYYLDLIDGIRSAIPGAAITSDIMVGFPGETEEDFLATLEVVERVRYDAAFTFIYNKRRGTPAEGLADQVPEGEKTRRIEALIKRQNEISLEKNIEEAGQVHQVLVEGVSKTDPSVVSGRTRTNKLVFLPGGESDIGLELPVRIVGGTLTCLEGEALKENRCPCV